MKTYKITIAFKTLPRFGKAGLDDQDARDHLGADQFFSALSLAWIEIFGLDDYKKSVLEPFISAKEEKDLPWLHSSFFPEINGEFYLPAPLIKFSNEKREAVGKKERQPWIRFQAIDKLLKGRNLEKDDYASAMKDYNYEAVNLNNFTADPQPYITAVLGPSLAMLDTGKKGPKDEKSSIDGSLVLSGLFDINNNKTLEKIDQVCNFLEDEGLGANRSSGYGQIKKIKRHEYQKLNDSEGVNRWILLSDYIPSVNNNVNEIDKIKASEKSAYKLISKSGWIYSSSGSASDKRKQKIYMMATGSSFDFKPFGNLVNVGSEEYPSYRYGFAYNLGLNLN